MKQTTTHAVDSRTPMQQNPIIMMASHPVPHRTAAQVGARYLRHPTERSLADAFADASNAFFWLAFDADEADQKTKKGRKALAVCQRWECLVRILQGEIIQTLRGEGVEIPECGYIDVLIPFMARNGFAFGGGWWIKMETNEKQRRQQQ